MPRLRTAIIGVGRHGARYARHAARDVEGLELVAVCRRDRDRGQQLADELGCSFTDDASALVTRNDIDVVVLVLPPAAIPSLAVRAAQAGKRLLIEKPVAASLAEGRRVLARIEETGTYCMAGHTLRFNVVVNALRDRIASLGRLDTVVFSQRFPPQFEIEWLDQPELSGGGSLLHTGVHCFDLIRYLTGLDPTAASCVTRSVYTKGTEDSFVAALTLSGGDGLAMVTCSRTTDSRNGLIEVSGEHGQLVGDHVLHTLYTLGPNGREDIVLPPAAMTVRAVLEQLVSDAGSGALPRATYRDGLLAVAVAEACYASAHSGRFERVAPL